MNPIVQRALLTAGEREAAQATATSLITDLLRCVLWLIRHGIYITGFRGWRGHQADRIVVTVAASPSLYRLFAGDCAWSKRRQQGALTIYTWAAERFGIRIEWEEASCG